MIRGTISVVVILVLLIGALVYWSVRSTSADSALGAAVDVYTAPLAMPGAPAQTGVYSTASERAKEANREFVAVAKDFTALLPQSAKAHYFAGVTYEELGQNGSAESELKTAAGSWDHNLANLSTLALAGLYQQAARDGDAIALYNQLIAKPSALVSAMAQRLADLYASEGKKDQARALWAKVQDADKEGAAGQAAAQKLAGK